MALPEDALTGLQLDDTFVVSLGVTADNLRWVYWNPHPAHTTIYVENELRNPSLSLNDFTDVFDPTDHSLNNGDNVKISASIHNAASVATEIENIIDRGTTIRVVVVDSIGGFGQNTYGHIGDFSLVKIEAYASTYPRPITFTYLGPAEDPEVCRQFALSLTPSQSQTGWPGQVLTYTHKLTNEGNYTETVWLTYTTSVSDWPVAWNLINQTLASGQAVAFTTVVTIPANSPPEITQATRITATLVVVQLFQ